MCNLLNCPVDTYPMHMVPFQWFKIGERIGVSAHMRGSASLCDRPQKKITYSGEYRNVTGY